MLPPALDRSARALRAARRLMLVLVALLSWPDAPLAADATPRTLRDCPGCPELVIVPPGEVTIGSAPDTVDRGANEGPKRRIRLARALAVGRHEITRGQWREFVEATERPTADGCQYYDGHYGYVQEHNWRTPGFPQRADHPVVCVSV